MNSQGAKDAAVLPAWFEDHPLSREIMQERADGILKRRTAAQKEICHLRAEEAKARPEMQAAIIDAETELQLLEEHKLELQEKYFKAARALSILNYSTEKQIGIQEAILRETCDPAIDEAIEFFRAKITTFRSPSSIMLSQYKGSPNGANFKEEIGTRTNFPAILEAMDYSRAAIEEIERMKLSPACDAERIEALKAGIPSIDVCTETESYGYGMLGF